MSVIGSMTSFKPEREREIQRVGLDVQIQMYKWSSLVKGVNGLADCFPVQQKVRLFC